MEQVVNVSIAGISFTLEKDACTLLEGYLAELKIAYKDEENSPEIIDSIEERIAELILEWGIKERVVSCREINNIIGILGHPGDIREQEPDTHTQQKDRATVKKKLYRDISNKVLGGVCSGLGAYFGADPVMVRLVFVFLALVTSIFGRLENLFLLNFGMGSFGMMVLVYLLFWIIVPSAKTVEQKCAMYGCSTKVYDIPKSAKCGGSNMASNGRTSSGLAGKIINIAGVCLGVAVLVAGLAGLVSGMFLVFGLEIIEGISLLSVIDYIELGVDNTLLLKILATVVYTVPFLGLIYLGVLLCFKIKSPAWRPGLIMFIIWIASAFALGALCVKSAVPYMSHDSWSDDLPVSLDTDTLYINMEPFEGIDESNVLEVRRKDDIKADYIAGKGKEKVFVKYPQVEVVKHVPQGEEVYRPFVELKSKVYNGEGSYCTGKPTAMDSVCAIKDPVVYVYPKIYSKDNKFNGERLTLWVHVPSTMEVILTDEKGKRKDFEFITD